MLQRKTPGILTDAGRSRKPQRWVCRPFVFSRSARLPRRTAHDGLAGMEAAAASRPDVILLDIGMPKLNGYDACRRIRAEPWGRDVLIVAVTGWGQEEDKGDRGRFRPPPDQTGGSRRLGEAVVHVE